MRRWSDGAQPPWSDDQEINYSRSNQGKRKRRSSDDSALVPVLKELVKVSARKMDIVAEAFPKWNEDRSNIAKEFKNMGLSPFEQIRALKFILKNPQNISLFMSLDVRCKRFMLTLSRVKICRVISSIHLCQLHPTFCK
ncbi:hypothetical protein ACOSP7_023368 [Xanthoceras sorbifolium]